MNFEAKIQVKPKYLELGYKQTTAWSHDFNYFNTTTIAIDKFYNL